jgi:hypothetical protein
MKMLIQGDHLEVTRMALMLIGYWLREGSSKNLTDYQLLKKDSLPCKYYLFLSFFRLNQDSLVSIMNRLQAGKSRNRVSIPERDKKVLSSLKSPDLLWCPPTLLFSGYQRLFPRYKAPEHEGDHSLPATAKVNNKWCFPPPPPPLNNKNGLVMAMET